jgi:hypothetical protein
MKIMKIILMFRCYILIIIKWILWIPYLFLTFPFTEKFMHEYELPMYPHYWLETLKEKKYENEI